MKKNNKDFIRSKHVDKNIYRKDNGKKKWTFYLVLILMVFWSVGSVLGIVVTAKDCNTVKADRVNVDYSFQGSNLIVLARTYRNQTTSNSSTLLPDFIPWRSYQQLSTRWNFRTSWVENSSTGDVELSNTFTTEFTYDNISSNNSLSLYYSNGNLACAYGEEFRITNFTGIDFYLCPYTTDKMPSNGTCYGKLTLLCEPGFIANITRVRMWHGDFTSDDEGFSVDNNITYYDVNNKSLTLSFEAGGDYSQTALERFIFSDRTYYLSNDISDNQYYQEGFYVGKDEGFSEGTEYGYSQGKQAGLIEGEAIGYNRGVESANQYTFLSLLGAVVDAPLGMIQDMLNFNVLGMNMNSFFFGMITVALIIFVIRKIL